MGNVVQILSEITGQIIQMVFIISRSGLVKQKRERDFIIQTRRRVVDLPVLPLERSSFT